MICTKKYRSFAFCQCLITDIWRRDSCRTANCILFRKCDWCLLGLDLRNKHEIQVSPKEKGRSPKWRWRTNACSTAWSSKASTGFKFQLLESSSPLISMHHSVQQKRAARERKQRCWSVTVIARRQCDGYHTDQNLRSSSHTRPWKWCLWHAPQKSLVY